MDWIVDHWWVFNTIPYVAFNVWLVRSFERDEGPMDDFVLKAALYVAGMVIVLSVFAWTTAEALGAAIDRFNWRTYRNRTAMFVPGERALLVAKLTFRFAAIVAGLAALYVLSLATTGYRPTRFEIIADGLLIVTWAAVMVKWMSSRGWPGDDRRKETRYE